MIRSSTGILTKDSTANCYGVHMNDCPPPVPAIVIGVGSPQWLHVGMDGQWGRWGLTTSLGTVGLAGSWLTQVRYHLWENERGPFATLGGGMTWLWPQSPETPVGLDGLGLAAVGWRDTWGPWILDLEVGPPPWLTGRSTLFSTAAGSLPVVRLHLGYRL